MLMNRAWRDTPARGDAMSVPFNFISQQFAVISVHSEPCCERLVLAYRDEKNLRDCLADASILALGYRSREEALAHMDRSVVAAPALAKNERAGVRNRLAQFFNGRQLASAGSFHLQRSGSTIVRLLQHGLVFAIALIYSKNMFSAMFRALVSF
jgi:hypothetical protein